MRSAAEAGANGFIIPHLPPDETTELETLCRDFNLDMVYLLPPNSRLEYAPGVSEILFIWSW